MEQRRNAIVKLIDSQGSVSFARLRDAFPQVSEMTLRTDLKALDQANRIVRTYGGAKSVEQVIGTDDLLGRRMARNSTAKEIIARKALSLLHPNMTIYLDSGSTTTALARVVPDEHYLIYTNGLSCATELARLASPRVTIPGGDLNRYSMSVCGLQTYLDISRVNFDLMFLGVTCYSPETGFTCGVEMESRLKQAVIGQSERVVVLMDSTKVGQKSTFTICDLSQVDILISDGDLPPEFLEQCTIHNVTVY